MVFPTNDVDFSISFVWKYFWHAPVFAYNALETTFLLYVICQYNKHFGSTIHLAQINQIKLVFIRSNCIFNGILIQMSIFNPLKKKYIYIYTRSSNQILHKDIFFSPN